jgi:hypothetical protein
VTPEELYSLWAPADSVWSPWVLPVPFAQLVCPKTSAAAAAPSFNLDWLPFGNSGELAMIVDLPGGDVIYYGLALLERGYRPVPVIDGSPGPDRNFIFPPATCGPAGVNNKSACVVDMRGLLLALCQGADQLRNAQLAPGAPPAFLLDSNRMAGVSSNVESAFDNRWLAFPQDFPSGRFLTDIGIRRVVLVHNTFLKDPQEDLAHVLLRWQEEGIAIESKSARFGDAPTLIQVRKPFRFRAAWYRALAAFGLRRNDAGGFGGYPPSPSSGG